MFHPRIYGSLGSPPKQEPPPVTITHHCVWAADPPVSAPRPTPAFHRTSSFLGFPGRLWSRKVKSILCSAGTCIISSSTLTCPSARLPLLPLILVLLSLPVPSAPVVFSQWEAPVGNQKLGVSSPLPPFPSPKFRQWLLLPQKQLLSRSPSPTLSAFAELPPLLQAYGCFLLLPDFGYFMFFC